MKKKVAVIGIGNEMKGDDGIGVLAAEKLGEKIKDYCTVLIVKTNVPENFIGKITDFGPDSVIVIDAADFGGRAGEVRIIEKEDIAGFAMSTHNAPLSIFFEVLKREINSCFHLIGVQVKSTEFGADISSEVLGSADDIVTLGENILEA